MGIKPAEIYWIIDLQKTFDRVPRDQLWQATGHDIYEIPTCLMKIIRSIYKKNESIVKTRDRDGRWFNNWNESS